MHLAMRRSRLGKPRLRLPSAASLIRSSRFSLPSFLGSKPATLGNAPFEHLLVLARPDVEALLRIFIVAAHGDLSYRANVASFIALVEAECTSKVSAGSSQKWLQIVDELRKVRLPWSAEGSYKSFRELWDFLEENTLLRAGVSSDEMQELVYSRQNRNDQLTCLCNNVSHAPPRGSSSLAAESFEVFRRLLASQGYSMRRPPPSVTRTEIDAFRQKRAEADVSISQRSIARPPQSPLQRQQDVHERIEERMIVDEEEEAHEDLMDEDDLVQVDPAAAAQEILDNLKQQMVQNRLAPLTPADRARALACLDGPASEAVLIEKFSIPITRRLMAALRPKEWLNDEIINYYMCMLQERDRILCARDPNRKPSFYFNSFFIAKLLEHNVYTYGNIKRWSKKFDVFTLRRVYFPININNSHWTHMVLYMEAREIHYYDSMAGNGRKYMDAVLRWVKDEAREKKGLGEYDVYDFRLIDHSDNIPQQENGFDCGAFSCIFADFDTDDLPFNFSQTNLPNWRLKMVLDILRGDLEYP